MKGFQGAEEKRSLKALRQHVLTLGSSVRNLLSPRPSDHMHLITVSRQRQFQQAHTGCPPQNHSLIPTSVVHQGSL